MRIILTGGGTGGHIYPAVAIADKIRRKQPAAEILFVGTERGMERDIVPAAGYGIRFVSASGLHRTRPLQNLKTVRDLLRGTREAGGLLDTFRPDLVIGTGGYVCAPVVRAAAARKIPICLHEQNALPGVANRFLSRYATKVFLSFPDAAVAFRQKEKLVVTGNPVRKGFLFPGNARERLCLGPGDFCLLCFGGSLGAERLNRAVEGIADRLLEQPALRMVFITGKRYFAEVEERFSRMDEARRSRLTLLPYADAMETYLNAADLVVGRAGALTVAEITACGKPSILIPSPHVTGNHQYHNAKAVADRGGTILIEEKDLTEEKLLSTILRLMNHKPALNAMAQASASLGRVDSAEAIYDEILAVLQKRK